MSHELIKGLTQPQYEMFTRMFRAAGIQGKLLSPTPIKGGRIHTSYFMPVSIEGVGHCNFLAQHFNEDVFKNPPLVMENIVAVTDYLSKNGYATLHPYRFNVDTGSESPYLFKAGDELWRIYDFIHSKVIDEVKTEREAQILAGGLAYFLNAVSGMDVSLVKEGIPNFHSTDVRFARFKEVVKADPVGRVEKCQKEIDYIMSRGEKTSIITAPLASGEIPLRVIHADPKANNVLLPNEDIKGNVKEIAKKTIMCDLDTMMPGALVYDTGDCLRFICNSEREDSYDWKYVEIRMNIFRAFTESFLFGAKDFITEREVELYVSGYWAMTQELGIRFLTDYLEGDVYFRIDKADDNLFRARIQLAEAARIEEHQEFLEKFVHETWKEICRK